MIRRIRLLPLVLVLALTALTSFNGYGQDATGVDFKAGENTWAGSLVGEWAEYTLAAGPSVQFKVTAIAPNGDLSFDHIIRNDKGEEVANNSRTRAPAKAPMQGRVPEGVVVAWGTADYTIGDVVLKCDTAIWKKEESTGEIWFCKDVPCGGIVKTATDGKDSVWLSSYSKDRVEHKLAKPEAEPALGPQPEPMPEPAPEPLPEPTPEPQPEPTPEPQPEPTPEPQPEPLPEPTPEPQPEPSPEPEPLPQPKPDPGTVTISSFGPPITMELPESVRKAMKDQGLAITRMHVYFEEEKSNEGAVLEYEGMRTEVPVIYAAFKGEQCDKELSYNEWLTRDGRFVDLAFDVKTKPDPLKGMGVKIVHSHLQGETETELSTYEITVPEADEPWDTLRLRGALPGINRYTLYVSYTNGSGETTTQKGFSHWVVVQAPPMFEFTNSLTATATRNDLGRNTTLEADVRMDASFLLHHGLDPNDCSLRITRKGKRDMNLSSLPPEVRRVIDKEKIPPGWQEVARINFKDGTLLDSKVVSVEDSFVKISFAHAFAASAAVLPVTEEWEYRFELTHKDSASPLASWSTRVELSVEKADDIRTAKLKVGATDLAKALEILFKKK